MNALFNYNTSDVSVSKTKSGKKITKFIYTRDAIDEDETIPVLGDFIVTNSFEFMIPLYKAGLRKSNLIPKP